MSTIAVPPAKILSQKSYQIAGKLKITEYQFSVPKDYSKPPAETNTLKIFARSVRKHDTPIVPPSSDDKTSKEKDQLPWLCYLQGGPGIECRAPQNYPFIHRFLDLGYQMLFVNSRGTSMSTTVTSSTLQMRGYNDVQAQYLKLYRADSIARDHESIRQALTEGYPEEKKKWSTIGQSFGGFVTISYLSFYPQGLRECFIFGGLQPLVNGPDEVYRRLFVKQKERNEAYYAKYPEDVENVKTIMKYLARFGDGKIKLPSDGNLTRRRFRQIGIRLGMHGGLDMVHDIVLQASSDIEEFGHLTRPTLATIDAQGMDSNLIYAILHEPIYCSGGGVAPNWSAHRVQEEFPEFDLEGHNGGPIYFTGETVYPWMFEDYSELRKVQDVANRVAADREWSHLWDLEQLAKNEVPVYAASYTEDMYVDTGFAMETAKAIKNCKVYMSNVVFHNAVSAKMDQVVGALLALRDDVVE